MQLKSITACALIFSLLVVEKSLALCVGTIPCSCTVSSSVMNFGDYSFVTPTPTNSSATVTVTCTSGGLLALSANFILVGSLSLVGNTQRQMTGPSTPKLLYNLYTSNILNLIWGDGLLSTATIAGNCAQACPGLLCGPRSCSQDLTVYGSIPAGQTVPAGTYNESVTVTVIF